MQTIANYIDKASEPLANYIHKASEPLHNAITNSESAKNIKDFIGNITKESANIEDPTLQSEKYKNNMKIGPLDEIERKIN